MGNRCTQVCSELLFISELSGKQLFLRVAKSKKTEPRETHARQQGGVSERVDKLENRQVGEGKSEPELISEPQWIFPG